MLRPCSKACKVFMVAITVLILVILAVKVLRDTNFQVYSFPPVSLDLPSSTLDTECRQCQGTGKSYTNFVAGGDGHSKVEPGPNLYKLMKVRKLYELRLEKTMRESMWYMQAKVSELPLTLQMKDTVQSIIQNNHDVMRIWYKEMNSVAATDSATQPNWDYWRKNISTELQALMQKRLHHLQNPKDCKSARKMVCEVRDNAWCGLGCQMHFICECFFLAYASERTLVFEEHTDRGWLTGYDSGGWNAVFQPLSPCRPSGDPESTKEWTPTSTENTVSLPPYGIRRFPPQPPPMAVPRDIVDRLASFHGFPFVWFISQFMHYLMRPTPALERYLREHEEKVGLTSANRPIVGVHVRHTDKHNEAPLYPLSEYMKHVEAWYDLYDLGHSGTKIKRRVFIATDDPEVIDEAKKGYPQYEVLSDPNIVSLASTKTRYSRDSLFGAISDVNVLSKCDFLVCTLSSTMGRLVYVMMQRYHVDASDLYNSVDGVYRFHGLDANSIRAIESHISNGRELSFSVGDVLKRLEDKTDRNGYSYVAGGPVPSYMFEKYLEVADFPTYSDVH